MTCIHRGNTMSQVSQQTSSLGLRPTATETRDKETQKLTAIICDEMAANGAECFQLNDCMEVYISGMDRDDAINLLNDYIADHAPMFHQVNMEFEFDEDFNGTDRFIMLYQSDVA